MTLWMSTAVAEWITSLPGSNPGSSMAFFSHDINFHFIHGVKSAVQNPTVVANDLVVEANFTKLMFSLFFLKKKKK